MKQPAFIARPSARYKSSYIDGVREYIGENEGFSWKPEILKARFDEYLQVLRQAETEPLAGRAPATRFWLIVDGAAYVGELDLRHSLNDALRRYGGHIGYKIRPSQRRKGYGTLLCRFGIEEARKRGIRDILITCDDDNIGSQKIIEANGGLLEDKVDNQRGALTRRYWVYDGGGILQPPSAQLGMPPPTSRLIE